MARRGFLFALVLVTAACAHHPPEPPPTTHGDVPRTATGEPAFSVIRPTSSAAAPVASPAVSDPVPTTTEARSCQHRKRCP